MRAKDNISLQPQLALMRVQVQAPQTQSLRLAVQAPNTEVSRVHHPVIKGVSRQLALETMGITLRPQMECCSQTPSTARVVTPCFRSADKPTNGRVPKPSLLSP